MKVRHPPGTWTIWNDSLWFYITKTAPFIDVKAHMRGPVRNYLTGMGTNDMSKTRTPYMLLDDWVTPTRTVLCLRAWMIWRARQPCLSRHGWANEPGHEGRQREVVRMSEALERDLRLAGAAPDLFGVAKADAMLKRWVPGIVARLREHT